MITKYSGSLLTAVLLFQFSSSSQASQSGEVESSNGTVHQEAIIAAIRMLNAEGMLIRDGRGLVVVRPDIIESLRNAGLIKSEDMRSGGWTPDVPRD